VLKNELLLDGIFRWKLKVKFYVLNHYDHREHRGWILCFRNIQGVRGELQVTQEVRES